MTLLRLNKERGKFSWRIGGLSGRSRLTIRGGLLAALALLSPAGLAWAQGGGLKIGVEVQAGPSSGAQNASGAPATPPAVAPRATAPAHVVYDKAVTDMVASLEASRQSALKGYSGAMAGENIFDPFMPPIPQAVIIDEDASGVKKQPLELMELNQIRLVAVVAAENGERTALVEDANGIGYIVQVGTKMGRRKGQLTAIHPDRLEVEEKVKIYTNEEKSRITAIKLYQVEGMAR